MIQINLNSNQPIYEQIIMQYKFMLLQKYLRPGDAIPSVRKLALELSVTPGTVAKAYQELERAGMIQTVRGKGTFIADKPVPKPSEKDMAFMKKKLSAACMELLYHGLSKNQIVDLTEELCDSIISNNEREEK